MDAYFAFAAFVLFICLAVAVYFIIAQRLLIEKLEAQTSYDAETIRFQNVELTKAYNKLERFKPFDADGDGRPGGRKRHDPYIER